MVHMLLSHWAHSTNWVKTQQSFDRCFAPTSTGKRRRLSCESRHIPGIHERAHFISSLLKACSNRRQSGWWIFLKKDVFTNCFISILISFRYENISFFFFYFFEFVTRLLILIEPQQLLKTTSVDKNNSHLRISGTYIIQKAMVNATFRKDFISNTKGQLRASTYLRSLSLALKTSKQVRSLRCVTYIFLYFTFQTYLLRVWICEK